MPNPTEAEEYYQRIRTDDHPVPLGVLAPPLREFVRGVGEDIPQAEILPLNRSQDEPLYSRLGIAVRVPARDIKEVCPRLVATAIDLRLLTYDRDGGYVMGM
ncbi:hypothetical protein J4H86_18900 [Spiractinospora alimapuensis]|uniref:hypothetical protein n=1 Tax=Spiractinospora alimapuensis TaxID=2820884 RepID=UPI001F30BBEF|nr:hypothetical protein [Spiractinospora alimapuensis]QVQ50913.1 hypothetical protein J4H86_18900 [Spiractinospora alimapuensis]